MAFGRAGKGEKKMNREPTSVDLHGALVVVKDPGFWTSEVFTKKKGLQD